jgi:hypothetical protein
MGAPVGARFNCVEYLHKVRTSIRCEREFRDTWTSPAGRTIVCSRVRVDFLQTLLGRCQNPIPNVVGLRVSPFINLHCVVPCSCDERT